VIASLTGQGNNVRHACRFLGVTESGYYAWRSRPTSPRALRRIFLAGEIVDVHRASAGIYGALRITAELRFGRQIVVGHNAVASIMNELAREIETITRRLAPQLLEQPGVGPHAAAQLVLSWSHRGRIGSEAAFARLAGAAPIPASSGQTVRYRLDRSGDRKLNRALHMILVTRKRSHPATITYIERRLQEGKTRREANRCLKRYLARSLYRLLEHGAPLAT